MKCPSCDKDLIAIEKNNLELNFCVECKGFWFDAWEWDELAEIIGFNENEFCVFSKNAIKNTGEKLKSCPVCNKVMEKIEVEGIILDRCNVDGGVWFDGNELQKILEIIAQKTNTDTTLMKKYLMALYKKQ